MSDRYIALTVLLERPIKDEDADAIIRAIQLIKGVMDVSPVIADPMAEWAKEAARTELATQVLDVLRKKP
jgi:hypothetical protein